MIFHLFIILLIVMRLSYLIVHATMMKDYDGFINSIVLIKE